MAGVVGAQGRILQHAVITSERQELLGVVTAAHRPEPGARAAGQDDGRYQTVCQDVVSNVDALASGFLSERLECLS